jgi:hypothetical protein
MSDTTDDLVWYFTLTHSFYASKNILLVHEMKERKNSIYYIVLVLKYYGHKWQLLGSVYA